MTMRWIRKPPGHIQLGGDPLVDPELVGGIIYLSGPGNASGSQEELENFAGERNVGNTLPSLLPPQPEDLNKMDGWIHF